MCLCLRISFYEGWRLQWKCQLLEKVFTNFCDLLFMFSICLLSSIREKDSFFPLLRTAPYLTGRSVRTLETFENSFTFRWLLYETIFCDKQANNEFKVVQVFLSLFWSNSRFLNLCRISSIILSLTETLYKITYTHTHIYVFLYICWIKGIHSESVDWRTV